MAAGILVFVEQRAGRVHPASLQLFTAARKLADAFGAEVEAVMVGRELDRLAETPARYGARRVWLVDDPELCFYRAKPYTRAVTTVIQRAGPQIVLLAATFLGRDLAPRVAVRTAAALATDCMELSPANGALLVERPMYSGRCVSLVKLEAGRLRIVSVRPNSFVAVEAAGSGAAATERLAFEPTDDDRRAKVLQVVRTGGTVKDVTEADIVVSGGRSLKSQENFKIVYELAEILDAAVGASRAAVDAGYQPHSRQVGLTGKVVTPKLYIACGIDGAVQHLAGMRGSKVIVAINTRRDAPIFDVATYGIVADLFRMVPLLTEEFRRLKESG